MAEKDIWHVMLGYLLSYLAKISRFCFVLKKKQQKKCIEFQEIPGINCLVRL